MHTFLTHIPQEEYSKNKASTKRGVGAFSLVKRGVGDRRSPTNKISLHNIKMMHHPLMILFTALLFFVLTPGILLTLPAQGSLATKAMVHAFVFALVYHFTHKIAYKALYGH